MYFIHISRCQQTPRRSPWLAGAAIWFRSCNFAPTTFPDVNCARCLRRAAVARFCCRSCAWKCRTVSTSAESVAAEGRGATGAEEVVGTRAAAATAACPFSARAAFAQTSQDRSRDAENDVGRREREHESQMRFPQSRQ